MKKHYVDIDGYWGVIFIYDFDLLDMDEIAAILDSFGLGEKNIRESMRVLYGVNSGMTVSRPDLTMSVVIISATTSASQFFDTLVHEIDHVQDAVDMHYGVMQGSEDSAWLQGYIMRGITEALEQDGIICER